MGLLSSIFGGGGSSSSTTATSTTDARSVTDNSGGSLVGTNNRVTVSVSDGSASLVPVLRETTKAAADVNVQAFRALATGQAALVDLLKTRDQSASGQAVSKAGLYAAAAVAAAVLLTRKG